MAASVMFGQTALELAKQQQELEAFNRKVLNAKPTKDAKKQAKELKKEGWAVPAGEASIEQQITKSLLYGEELMMNEDGSTTKRFLMQTGSTQTCAHGLPLMSFVDGFLQDGLHNFVGRLGLSVSFQLLLLLP